MLGPGCPLRPPPAPRALLPGACLRLSYPHCELDLDAQLVRRGGEEHRLSPIEASLLRHLSGCIDQVVDRYVLLEAVWGVDSDRVVSRAVDVAVCRLRRKIERDPADPEIVLTVPGAGYRLCAPPAAPPRRAHNLPPLVGRFIGRDHELRWLGEAMSRDRIVVLRGSPGIGKTRLARQYAQAVVDGPFAPLGGVWFCDLSDAETEAEALGAVAWTLSVPLPVGASPEAARRRCVEALSWRGPTLLLLDNAEGVTEAVDRLLVEISASGVKHGVLVTSQHALAGAWVERELLPLAETAARVLLSARAFEVGADLGPGADGGTDALVALLEGVPLALELAAAQLRSHHPRQIIERLEAGGISLPAAPALTEGRRSLRAALRVALDRLNPEQRALMLALSVFEGGAPIDGLAAVAEALGVAPSDLLTGLDKLQRASLISRGPERPPRYRLLAAVQAAAQQRASAADLAAAHAALAQWLSAAAEGWRAEAEGAAPRAAIDRLLRERANLRVAGRAMEPHDPSLSLRLTLLRAWVTELAGGEGEPPERLRAALEAWRGRVPPLQWARLALVCARRMRTVGAAAEARGVLEQAIGLIEPLAAGDDEAADLLAMVLASAADAHRVVGEAGAAEALLQRALGVARGPTATARVRGTFGLLCSYRSDFDGAELHLSIAEQALSGVAAGRELAFVINSLAANAGRRGQEELARARYARARALCIELGYEAQQMVAEAGLAQRLLSAGQVEDARQHLLAALRFERASGDRRMQAFALGSLGVAAMQQGDLVEGRALLHEAQDAFAGRDRLGASQALVLEALIDLEEGALDAGLGLVHGVLAERGRDGDLDVMAESVAGALCAAAGAAPAAAAHFAAAAAAAVGAPRHAPLLRCLAGEPEALAAAPATAHQLVRVAARIVAQRPAGGAHASV